MLLGTLAVILLVNLLASKGKIRVGEDTTIASQDF